MGFLSAVGGAISSIGSAVCGAIGSVAGKVGSAVSGFAKSFIGIVSHPMISMKEAIEFIADVVHFIAVRLGIVTEDDPEILGAKAEQAEKGIEDFDDDVEAYIKYLKEEVELDKEKFENMTPEERMGCKTVGLTLETKAIENKIGGVQITPECLALLVKLHLVGTEIDPKELLNTIKGIKAAGITNMNDVVDYLEGKGNSDRIHTGEVLKEVIGEGAEEKIGEWKESVRKYEE